MPEKNFTKSAKKTNGLDKKKLEEKKAVEFTKGKSNILVSFLNTHKDLPIVTHNVAYDRDTVLSKAFEKVGNFDKLPPKERWKCTMKMAQGFPDITVWSLDGVLDHFGLEGRDEDKPHDALVDCILTAAAYMKLMTKPPPPTSSLGFKMNWEKDE